MVNKDVYNTVTASYVIKRTRVCIKLCRRYFWIIDVICILISCFVCRVHAHFLPLLAFRTTARYILSKMSTMPASMTIQTPQVVRHQWPLCIQTAPWPVECAASEALLPSSRSLMEVLYRGATNALPAPLTDYSTRQSRATPLHTTAWLLQLSTHSRYTPRHVQTRGRH